jgi:hypothetical protein
MKVHHRPYPHIDWQGEKKSLFIECRAQEGWQEAPSIKAKGLEVSI